MQSGAHEMKTTISKYDFIESFRRAGRGNQFTHAALDLIFEYIEGYEQDTGEEIELDVVGICCEWAESTPEEILEQYETDIDTEGMTEEQIATAVYEWLNDETIVAGQCDAYDLV
jgi:hypothetical protein